MFVRVKILLQQRSNALLLPKKAILRNNNETSVFVMNDDQTAENRVVLLGLEDSEFYEVLAGLKADEKLIVVGQHKLEDGQSIRLIDIDTPNPDDAIQSKTSDLDGQDV